MRFRQRTAALISTTAFLAALVGPIVLTARAQSSSNAAAQSNATNASDANSQTPQFPTSLYADLQWRCIGPFRGGRTVAATGVPDNPNLFYIGVNNGGVWKTTDAGRTWIPIFDDQPTGSIGALAVAPSQSRHHLRRQRRRLAPARSFHRRRHLQIHRRRQNLAAPRPARRPANRRHHRRPARSQSRFRRGARPSLRPERRARRLPFH